MATTFSNTPGSNQSSLGLARTAETYEGDNGYCALVAEVDRTTEGVDGHQALLGQRQVEAFGQASALVQGSVGDETSPIHGRISSPSSGARIPSPEKVEIWLVTPGRRCIAATHANAPMLVTA